MKKEKGGPNNVVNFVEIGPVVVQDCMYINIYNEDLDIVSIISI